MRNLSLKDCEELISNYIDRGGELTEFEEGCLGLGTLVLHGLKSCYVIKEYFISAWCSGHTVQKFKKLPKKYDL